RGKVVPGIGRVAANGVHLGVLPIEGEKTAQVQRPPDGTEGRNGRYHGWSRGYSSRNRCLEKQGTIRRGWGIGAVRKRALKRSSKHTSMMSMTRPEKSPAEKRQRDDFFRLVDAARNRNTNLLRSVVDGLIENEDKVRSETGLSPNVRPLQDVLLRAASRCGQLVLAERVFKVMLNTGQCPTLHTAGAFLDALKTARQADRCVAVSSQLLALGATLSDVCLNIVVAALVQAGDFKRGMDTLKEAETEWGIRPDTCTFNTILNEAVKQGSTAGEAAAEEAYKLMTLWGVAPDCFTVNSQISHAIKGGQVVKAIELFELVLEGGISGVLPDIITFNTGISAYMANLEDDKAMSLLDEIKRRDLEARADTFNTILTGLIKMGQTQRALQMFNDYLRFDQATKTSSIRPSTVTYNLVLEALRLDGTKGNKAEAELIFKEMETRGVKPDSVTLGTMVRQQGNAENVYKLMRKAISLRLPPSRTFLNSCIRALGDHGDLYGACRILDYLQYAGSINPDVVSYNSLMYALVQDPWVTQVIEGESGNEPFTPIYATANMGDPTETPQGEDSSQGAHIKGETVASLTGMTGAQAAMLLLDKMKTLDSKSYPDTFSYTTVMYGVLRADAAGVQYRVRPYYITRTLESNGKRIRQAGREPPCKETCKALFEDARSRGVQINGMLINVIMMGFGDDIEGAVAFWKRHVRQALTVKGIPDQQGGRFTSERKTLLKQLQKDLFAAYTGLVHVCGRARRADVAVKIVYAMRRDGLTPTSVQSNTYFKAKEDTERVLDGDGKGNNFSMSAILRGQMESLLEVECGLSEYSAPMNLPIEKIRIRL
ncbi:unnamed protein product, partial [Choristocarpus tenellus]